MAQAKRGSKRKRAKMALPAWGAAGTWHCAAKAPSGSAVALQRPTLELFGKKGLVVRADGTKPPDAVYQEIRRQLGLA